MMQSEQCPCGRERSYQACCGPLHTRNIKAKTAEQLMRSRYSAFRKGLVDYLVETLHPSKRSGDHRLSLEQTLKSCQWLKLEILDVSAGTADDDLGFVEFRAYFEAEKIGVSWERSRFLKEEGVWYYVDGEHKKPVLPGRNDPCWCGSGKKNKKCHGKHDDGKRSNDRG